MHADARLEAFASYVADLVIEGRQCGTPLRSVSIGSELYDYFLTIASAPWGPAVQAPYLILPRLGIGVYRSNTRAVRGSMIYPHYKLSLN